MAAHAHEGAAPAEASSPADTAEMPSAASEELVVTGRRFPEGRLSRAVRPLAYRLDLTLDPANPRYSGRVEIDVALDRPQHEIVLHGRNLAVRKVEARFGGRAVEGKWRQLDPSGVVRLTFPEPLPIAGATLAFDYDADLHGTPFGLFRVQVAGKWYIWSQFQSVDARAAFPCFDDPGFKAPFSLTLRTPPGLTAIGNAMEVGPPVLERGSEVHRFEPTLPLPTYLVAVMAGPFAVLEGAVPPTPERAVPLPVRIVTTQPNAQRMAYALEGTKDIVRRMESWFGSAFPFPKLDQISTPILPGGMENAAANLYRDDLLILDETSPVPRQREFGRVVAHEIAHQWFGNLVTPEWWDDLWLNESFANWLSYRIADAWRPEMGIGTGVLAEGFAAMQTDALVAGRAVRQDIERSDEVDAAFDAITYGKGAHILAMTQGWLGRDRFQKAVRRFVEAHRFSSATSEEFFASLGEASGEAAIVTALRSFIEQPGVPLLLLRREGKSVTISQVRYGLLGASPSTGLWSIPVCLRRGTVRTCRMITRRTETFGVPGTGAVVPNADGSGYYRFELAGPHWRALIRSAGSMPSGEVLALTDSLEASIRAGRGTVSEMASLARRVARHADPAAAMAPDRALSRLMTDGLVGAPGRASFGRFRQGLYERLLDDLGFDPRAGAYAREASARSERRRLIVASYIGSPRGSRLRRQLDDAAKGYLAGDTSALDPAWFDHAFDIYLYFGGAGAARVLVERALDSEDSLFRPIALAAAARTGNRDIARWLIQLDDPRLREGERRDILGGVMLRSATREQGYEWMLANSEDLLEGNGGTFAARQLPEALSHFCDTESAERIGQDFRPILEGTPSAMGLERAIEKVASCALFERLYGQQINLGFEKLD
jgi:hypothetical protein